MSSGPVSWNIASNQTLRVSGFGFWVLGFGFWVLGFGFWVGGWGVGVVGGWVVGLGVWGVRFNQDVVYTSYHREAATRYAHSIARLDTAFGFGFRYFVLLFLDIEFNTKRSTTMESVRHTQSGTDSPKSPWFLHGTRESPANMN